MPIEHIEPFLNYYYRLNHAWLFMRMCMLPYEVGQQLSRKEQHKAYQKWLKRVKK